MGQLDRQSDRLSQAATHTKAVPPGMSFTQWRLANQEFVAMGLLSTAQTPRQELSDYLAKNPARPHECYQNAQRLCAALPHVGYVVGRVTVPTFGTVDHAWNADEFGHFDITLAGDQSLFTYQAFVTLTSVQVTGMTWMGMPPTVFEIFMALQNNP